MGSSVLRCYTILVVLLAMASSGWADGCHVHHEWVWRWSKRADINEPSQNTILLPERILAREVLFNPALPNTSSTQHTEYGNTIEASNSANWGGRNGRYTFFKDGKWQFEGSVPYDLSFSLIGDEVKKLDLARLEQMP